MDEREEERMEEDEDEEEEDEEGSGSSEEEEESISEDDEQRTPLHVAAFHGHHETVSALLAAGADVNTRDNEQWTPLHLAALNGYQDIVSALLTAGVDVNARDKEQWTPLHAAALNGHHEAVSALLTAGADVNARNKEDVTPIHLAAKNGHHESVSALLKNGADVNALDDTKRTPLHLAAHKGHHETVSTLLTAGADVNARDCEGITAMHMAAQNGHRETVPALLTAGADVDARDSTERTPLFMAAKNGHHETVSALLTAGADVNARSESQWTPLHAAAHNGHHETVSALLTAGADVNARNKEDVTPLLLAAHNGHHEAVSALLTAGADVNARDKEDITPTHLAAHNGHHETVSVLLTAGADVNARDEEKRTPLHAAAQNGHQETVPVLLTAGADVNARDDRDITPLHMVAQNGHYETVSALVTAGADVNERAESLQWTALHAAAQNGHQETVSALLTAGADVNARNKENVNPLHMAAQNGHHEAVSVLLTAGADVNARDRQDVIAIHLAAENGHHETVSALLTAGADVNARNKELQWTALHAAAQNGHQETVSALLTAGADVNARNKQQWTPLHAAAWNGHHEIVSALLTAGADVNALDNEDVTPLHLAAENGHHETVSALLTAGADVNARDKADITPIHLAAENGHHEIVSALLAAGADVNARDNKERTPHFMAAQDGHHETMSALLTAGADVNARTESQGAEDMTSHTDDETSDEDSHNGDGEEELNIRASRQQKEYDPVLVRFYEDRGMAVASPLIQEAAKKSGKTVAQVKGRPFTDDMAAGKSGVMGHQEGLGMLTKTGDSSVPLEIRLRGPAMQQLYSQACRQGARPVHNTRGLVVGQFRSGKTCVVSRLTGEEAVEDEPITDGIEISPSVMTKIWRKAKEEPDEFKETMAERLAKQQERKKANTVTSPRTQKAVDQEIARKNATHGRETSKIQKGDEAVIATSKPLQLQQKKGGKRKAKTRHMGQTSSPPVKRPKREVISILLVNDEYGNSHGGTSTVNRQVAQFLQRHGATVHCTALQATEDNKRCAKEDGVILHLPVQRARKKKAPSLEWLTDYHSIHYPDIPQDLKCIVGHADVTSEAAKSIQEERCQHAKLVLFNHDMPEDTAHYKGTLKAMAAGKKVGDILEDTKNADAVFSLGRRIYDHYETKYGSLGDSKPTEHLMFLPRPSPLFKDISVKPGGGEKVVLTVGRVTEVEKLKGHDLVARSMGEVAEKIPNVKLRVRGIDEDDWEASKKILEENLHSGKIKPTLLPCGTLEDIAQDMQQAHLVLMPSRAEPFGLIGLEAIAAGIPVLISDKSGLADMIKDLIKEKKCHPDMRYRIVETSVRESDQVEDAREWAKKIADTLEFSEAEFEKAAEFKKQLLESRYWEESHQNLLRVCGLID